MVHGLENIGIRQRSAAETAEQTWPGVRHAQQGQMLGQRGDVALLPELEDGMRLAERLRKPCRSHE